MFFKKNDFWLKYQQIDWNSAYNDLILCLRRMLVKKALRDKPYRNQLFWLKRDLHKMRYWRYLKFMQYYILRGARLFASLYGYTFWYNFLVHFKLIIYIKITIYFLSWLIILYILYGNLTRPQIYFSLWQYIKVYIKKYKKKFRNWRYTMYTLFKWARRRHIIKVNMLFFKITTLVRIFIICLFNLYLVKIWFILALQYFATGLVRSYLRHYIEYTIETYNFTFIYWYFFYIYREQVFYFNILYGITSLGWLIRDFLVEPRWLNYWRRRLLRYLDRYMFFVHNLIYYRPLAYRDPQDEENKK